MSNNKKELRGSNPKLLFRESVSVRGRIQSSMKYSQKEKNDCGKLILIFIEGGVDIQIRQHSRTCWNHNVVVIGKKFQQLITLLKEHCVEYKYARLIYFKTTLIFLLGDSMLIHSDWLMRHRCQSSDFSQNNLSEAISCCWVRPWNLSIPFRSTLAD